MGPKKLAHPASARSVTCGAYPQRRGQRPLKRIGLEPVEKGYTPSSRYAPVSAQSPPLHGLKPWVVVRREFPGTIRNFARGGCGAINHPIAIVKCLPERAANWDLAMDHSRGSIISPRDTQLAAAFKRERMLL